MLNTKEGGTYNQQDKMKDERRECIDGDIDSGKLK